MEYCWSRQVLVSSHISMHGGPSCLYELYQLTCYRYSVQNSLLGMSTGTQGEECRWFATPSMPHEHLNTDQTDGEPRTFSTEESNAESVERTSNMLGTIHSLRYVDIQNVSEAGSLPVLKLKVLITCTSFGFCYF
jgi:hypothetical protein